MGIKKNNPGCVCCGCNRTCDFPVNDPWEIQGTAATRYGELSLTGINATHVSNSDTIILEATVLGSGHQALQVLTNPGGIVLAEYSSLLLPIAPAVLTLAEVSDSGVSGQVTKLHDDWPNEVIYARGTRRPKLVVGGTRIRKVSWELISVPDPWDWEFDTFQPYFPNTPVTLTDSWNGMSGLIGEYVVDLDQLQCRDGGIFGITPYVADAEDGFVGSLDGTSILFSEANQRLELVPANVPAYYGLNFTDTTLPTHPPVGSGSSVTHGKTFSISGSERTLLSGQASLLFVATTCLAMPQRTDELTTSNLTVSGGNYRSTGSVTWRTRLLET